MRTWINCAMFAQLIVATAQPIAEAAAQTFDVKQVDVKQGSLELGLDNTAQQGLPRSRGSNVNHSAHDQSLDYGFRDWWRLSAVLKLENPQDADFRIAKTAVDRQ